MERRGEFSEWQDSEAGKAEQQDREKEDSEARRSRVLGHEGHSEGVERAGW